VKSYFAIKYSPIFEHIASFSSDQKDGIATVASGINDD
jgi:hypothetical protein